MHLIDLISSKLELFRLEQRYTKRRSKRSTFVSSAEYVDGEYVYTSKHNTGSSSSSSDGAMVAKISDYGADGVVNREEKEGKVGRRLSKMGLGSMGDWRQGRGGEKGRPEIRVSVEEIRWQDRS